MAAMDARTTAHIHDVPGKVGTGAFASQVLGPPTDPADTAVYFATTYLVSPLRFLRRRAWAIATAALEGGVRALHRHS